MGKIPTMPTIPTRVSTGHRNHPVRVLAGALEAAVAVDEFEAAGGKPGLQCLQRCVVRHHLEVMLQVSGVNFRKNHIGRIWLVGTSKNSPFQPPRKSDSKLLDSERGMLAWDSLASSI